MEKGSDENRKEVGGNKGKMGKGAIWREWEENVKKRNKNVSVKDTQMVE